MTNPIKDLARKDWFLWIGSLIIVTASNLLAGEVDVLTIVATYVGITALIFAAKGNVWSQILMVIFSILYGIISYRFHYWGEMITYLGMTMPMAIWSTYTWLRHPSGTGNNVKIQRMTAKMWVILVIATAAVTAVFYVILDALDTPNIVFSTISVTTSFFAASLTMLRSSYYGLFYAANDVVLIVLWTMAAMENPVYIPVIVNFAIFFINDLNGFWNWKKREYLQDPWDYESLDGSDLS